MRKPFTIGVLTALVFAVPAIGWLVHHSMSADHEFKLTELQAVWDKERAHQAAALKKAMARNETAIPVEAPVVVTTPGASKLIAELRSLSSGSGTPARRARLVIHTFEELIALGPAALPAIRDYFARDEDRNFDIVPASKSKSGRTEITDEFVVPPSLRFGLLDVVQTIGGRGAEMLLSEILGTTGRGVELAWIARALQRSAPNQYRVIAVAGAHELLDRPLAAEGSPLDRNDRDHLFSVLSMYGDTEYVVSAQTQLVHADGAIDRSALKYLQQSLGPQSVAIAAKAWNDPRLADPATKEPLARLALSYAGADQQANDFYITAINDMGLTKDQRSNLIEDLNEEGFPDRKNLSATDLPLIENRLALIEQLASSSADEANAAAFKEAYKDLVNMRDRVSIPPPPSK